MLKRKKQLLLAATAEYIREAQVPLQYDPTVCPKSDGAFVPTPPDPPQRDCTIQKTKLSAAMAAANGHQRNGGGVNGYQESKENGDQEHDGEEKAPNAHTADAPCPLDHCKLGCVCDSVALPRSIMKAHCGTSGDPDCIFGCICHQLEGGERKKFKLRWQKVSVPSKRDPDDDCGFIPPGSQVSLAHYEDGRPKRKSQPPERFRHGFDLNKVTLDKNFSAGGSFRSMPKASTTIRMVGANGCVQKTRIIVGSGSGTGSLRHHRVRFGKYGRVGGRSAGTRRMLVPGTRGQPTAPLKQLNANSQQQQHNTKKCLVAHVRNPCSGHDHQDYNMDSIVSGFALKVKTEQQQQQDPSAGPGGDGVLISRLGTVVAGVSWTVDGYRKPTVGRLLYSREETKKDPGADELLLPILHLPCSDESGTGPSSHHYRFFELPPTYAEYNFLLYSQIHVLFSVQALRTKIKSQQRGVGGTGPRIVDLNSLNLNQPVEKAKRGNVYLLLYPSHMIIVGTVPEAYRERKEKRKLQLQNGGARRH